MTVQHRLLTRPPGSPPLQGTAEALLASLDGETLTSLGNASKITGRDRRTLIEGLESGTIPGGQVGRRWLVSVPWLRSLVYGGGH